MSSSTPPSGQGRAFATPVLLVSPENDYAAIFEIGSKAVILKSQAGRCVVSYPLLGYGTTHPAVTGRKHFEALGYVRQSLPSDNLAGFLQEFMLVAGFTFEQVERAVRLGTPS